MKVSFRLYGCDSKVKLHLDSVGNQIVKTVESHPLLWRFSQHAKKFIRQMSMNESIILFIKNVNICCKVDK
jgi:hypothetical protein